MLTDLPARFTIPARLSRLATRDGVTAIWNSDRTCLDGQPSPTTEALTFDSHGIPAVRIPLTWMLSEHGWAQRSVRPQSISSAVPAD